MKRRDAIKQLGFATGVVIATPAILSILNSCTSPNKQWKPKYLSTQQGQVLNKLVDVFLPKTELPSATELNVPEFIDRYIGEIFDVKDQNYFTDAFTTTLNQLKDEFNIEIKDIEDKHLKLFLDKYLKTKSETDKERNTDLVFEGMTTSAFLGTIKTLSINAYLNTTKIGEEVLAYDPIPGAYYCDDLQKLTQGKSWSLNLKILENI